MSESKHFPWSLNPVSDIDFSHEIYAANGKPVAAIYEVSSQFAALIFAGPQLRDALRQARADLLELAASDQHLAPAIERIDVALAKAEGRT